MPATAMNHFTILTDDVPGTVRFYGDFLGLREGARPPLDFPGAWLYSGSSAILHIVGGRLRSDLNALLSGLDYHWEGDTLNFVASAMWQRITGRIEVLDEAVRVEIDLPWIMQLLRDTIAKRVCGRGVALLEKPQDET